MADLLKDKVCIVTGSGRGLGLAIAGAFAAEGARVVVSDLEQGACEIAAKGIPGATAMACDVRDEGQVQALVEGTMAQHGAVHVLVANAGVVFPSPILEMDLTAWRATTSVNLDGVFLSLRYAAPAIIDSGGGAIVTLSSITATAGTPLAASYAAAKAGVLNLTKTAAIELRESGVRVNALLPGFAATDMVRDVIPDFEEAFQLPTGGFDALIVQKQGRYGEPDDVARAAVFLASDKQSSWITGTGLIVDGGYTGSLF